MNWILTKTENSSADRTPNCYEVGEWGGKRSDLHLVKTAEGKFYVARMYEGIMDGSSFADWVDDENDSIIDYVVKFVEIED